MDGPENFPVFVSVVDDEEDLVYLFRDALSQIPGVSVLAFTDPKLALAHFETNHEKYGLVLSDYRMPAMTGVDLLEKVKEINPEVKRILISAFDVGDEIFSSCNCVDVFLQKPISMTDLASNVRSHIETPTVKEAT